MERQLADVSDVALKTFDFVIIGGGVAGCVLASRLSENPNASVALLEAGDAHFDDPAITTPDGWMKQVYDPKYDWSFRTTPQARALSTTTPDGKAEESFYWARGKGLGGSSRMNFLYWTRPQREEIEAIEKLGNPGWTWDRFFEASKRSETFHETPHTNHSAFESLYEANSVGHSGPIPVGFPRTVSGAEVPFQKALDACGVKVIKDGLGGSLTGTFKSASSVDPRSGTRSTAAKGYLIPALDRPNLKVLTNAYVLRIVTSGGDGAVVATAVEFEHEGKTYKVNVGKEAILSSSTVKSPHILELSGIGGKSILAPLGIPVAVDLPGVGANMQDHLIVTGSIFQMKKDQDFVTSDTLLLPHVKEKLTKLYGEAGGPLWLACSGCTFLPVQTFSDRADELIRALERRISDAAPKTLPGLQEQLQMQLDMLKNKDIPDIEIVVFPFNLHPTGGDTPYVGVFPSIGHPFSRGTIHASSSDPHVQPTIEPNYFDYDVDLELLVDSMKFIRKLAATEAWKAVSEAEILPGANVATDDQLRESIRRNLSTIWHASGTCSMLPKEKGGVVDAHLKVHGTKNIRVIDLSVLPLLTGVHTQAITYGIAEQGADIIKAEYGL
ncbi:GMC oxidoreductase [Earliella scabrosa]|nr:GMC oxidoreductase [Earliella scabrosa]